MPDRIVASLAEGVLMRRQEYLPSCIDAHTPSHTQYTLLGTAIPSLHTPHTANTVWSALASLMHHIAYASPSMQAAVKAGIQ